MRFVPFSPLVLLIAAVAGLIVLPQHAPGQHCTTNAPWAIPRHTCHAFGMSQTVYDVLRIATWGVLIVGALLVVVGLINYGRRPAADQARV